MKMYILAALTSALALPAPAIAQEMDHNMHRRHGAHAQSEAKADTAHEGHDMPQDNNTSTDSSAHSGHGAPAAGDPPIKPVDPAALSGPAHAADLVYDPKEMVEVRTNIMREHGDILVAKLMVDRLETKLGEGDDGYAWEADAWIGKDINKLWIKSEGEGAFGEPAEHAEVQALLSHAINPWFDLQGGVRQDFQPHPQRTHAVIGIQGLAPYWFEVSGAAFISDKGDVTARAEAEYDLRITSTVILQPRLELNLSAQNVPEIGLGSGLTDASLGVRLRYEFSPQFAPYIGTEWEGSFGDTKRYARAEGEDASRLTLVLGVRFWF